MTDGYQVKPLSEVIKTQLEGYTQGLDAELKSLLAFSLHSGMWFVSLCFQ